MNPMDVSLLGLATLASVKPLKCILKMLLVRWTQAKKVATPH